MRLSETALLVRVVIAILIVVGYSAVVATDPTDEQEALRMLKMNRGTSVLPLLMYRDYRYLSLLT